MSKAAATALIIAIGFGIAMLISRAIVVFGFDSSGSHRLVTDRERYEWARSCVERRGWPEFSFDAQTMECHEINWKVNKE